LPWEVTIVAVLWLEEGAGAGLEAGPIANRPQIANLPHRLLPAGSHGIFRRVEMQLSYF
jgi:hypothetical protein